MSDFKRTADGDIAIVNGDLALVEGVAAIQQDVEMTLRTWLGESVYNRLAGMPYLQAIFADGATPEAVRFVVEQRLLSIEGVTDVLELSVAHDRTAREATITGRIRVTTGDILTVAVTT
jgi:hypothetical protein